MFQKTSKTLYYMKISVCKIPPEGSGTLSGHWSTHITVLLFDTLKTWSMGSVIGYA